ncbi:MAG: alcohol dehydrogenase [Verrucomicrobia bacterium]|nr:alcohol dehydrogenase [Verrucomicrobiota bacterium]
MVTCMKTILLFALTTSLAFAGNWPAWRGPDRTGISAEQFTPTSTPKQLWKTNVGTGCATVSIADGRLYTMGNRRNTDIVWCLDDATGKELWKHEYPEPLAPHLYEGGPNTTPTADGDHVFTLSRSGQLFCLRADTGKVVWSRNLTTDFAYPTPKWGNNNEGWGHAGSPLVHGDKLILHGLALNKTTGALLWKADEPPAYTSPIIAFTNIVLLLNAEGLSLRNLDSGKLIAHHPWKTSYNVNAATPIIDGDNIFISSGYNRGATLLQFRDGKLAPLWENKKMRNQLATSILWQGHLYGFNEDTLTCLELATGEPKWVAGKFLGKGSLMMADGKLIILGDKGDLVIVEAAPAAYKELARAKVLDGHCWSMPVLANGRIYCKTIPGDLVCLSAQ